MGCSQLIRLFNSDLSSENAGKKLVLPRDDSYCYYGYGGNEKRHYG